MFLYAIEDLFIKLSLRYYYHMATGNYQRTRPFGQVDDLPDGWITKHADGPNGEPGKGGP